MGKGKVAKKTVAPQASISVQREQLLRSTEESLFTTGSVNMVTEEQQARDPLLFTDDRTEAATELMQAFEHHEEREEREEKKEIEESRSDIAPIHATKQVHALSTPAKLSRERVIAKLDTKEALRKQLLESNKSLDQVVEKFVSDEEKKRIAKDTKGRLKTFWQLKDALSKDPLMSTDEKARVLYNFARTFAADVNIFKSLYLSEVARGHRERQIEEYIDRFEELIDCFESGKQDTTVFTRMGLDAQNANTEMFGGDNGGILARAKAQARRIDRHGVKVGQAEEPADPDEQLLRAKKLDATLTKEQLAGVAAADNWLVSAGVKSPKRLPFINRIMSLSARERLFMYRIIETGHLEAPNMLDLSVSQTSYVPNVSTIDWNMLRVPFRLWEVAGSEGLMLHHWEKLEAALTILGIDEVAGMIGHFADEAERRQDAGKAKELTEEEQVDLDTIEDKDVRRIAREVMDARRERDALLDETIIAMQDCAVALEKRDSAWIRKKEKEKIAADKTKIAMDTLQRLLNKDADVATKVEMLDFKSDYTAEDVKGELKEYAAYATGQSLGVIAKLAQVPKLFAVDIATKGTKASLANKTAMVGNVELANLLTGVNMATGAAATTKAVLGFIASLKGIKQAAKVIISGDLSVEDSVFAATKSLYGLGASATGIGLGITSMAYATRVTEAMMTGVNDAIKTMTTGVGITQKILSGAGLVIDIADLAIQGKHMYHRTEARDQIHELRKKGTLKGDDAAYMKGILKLDTRNKVKQFTDTAFSLVTNTGNLASLSLGPAGVLAWTGMSVGISLANKVADYLMVEHSKKKTAEEFMQITDLKELLKDLPKDTAQKIMSDKKKVKELKASLMNHMAAELGFTTFTAFFKHIVGKYALFLRDNLFFDNDTAVYADDADRHAVSSATAQLLKGMGLRVKFPERGVGAAEAEKQRHPSIRMIAAKLGG